MSLQLEVDNSPGENSVALAKTCSMHRGMAIACCCAAIAATAPVALLQLRILSDLPELPGRFFNSRRVALAKDSYQFGIPNGVLAAASYGVTLALLIAAKPSRPWVRRALRAKLVLDAASAVWHVRKQITQHGRVCSWCIGAAVATAGVVYFSRKAREEERMRLV